MYADTIQLGEAYIEHFGVRGMRWGHRKASSSGSSGSSSRSDAQKKQRNRKIALGATVAVGTIGAIYLLRKNRTVKVRSFYNVSSPGLSSPSPFKMRMDAGMAAQRNVLNRIGDQKIADKTWRDAARMSQLSRSRFSAGNKSITDMSDLTSRFTGFTDKQIRENLANPNYVWDF